ncbi:MAG TPA: IS701 family transposase [Streptosporangiaceae bacterium]|nr:IS701 family transposase [Streptosporangiaceae bacterium]
MAASVIVEDQAWLGELRRELYALLAGVFAQARSRLTAFAYIGALLAEPGDRKSCWQLAETARHRSPRRMQALLAEYAWDWKAALAALQRFVVARLGDPEAIIAIDETAELKKGDHTIGVARQHAGITGQVENCQTVVFAAYVTARAHALFSFRLYLPRAWCDEEERRRRAHVPDDVGFTTKPDLGAQMVTGAVGAGVPFAWVAADEVYGRSSGFRQACEKAGKGYVLTVPANFQVMLPSGRKAPVAAVARMIPGGAWETRSCGPGCKGHRDYEWAWAATSSPRHWVLIRRSLSDPSDLAFFYCHAPEGRPVSLPVLIRVAGKRWPVEECFQQGKGVAGLDQHQVRTWHSFCRHTVLSMCAQAMLAVAAARPAPGSPAARAGSEAAAAQPAAWADTGKLPATADDAPPGDDPGQVKVSVPEAHHLLRLAATPTTAAARELGYAWSRWRRRHQARSRWHHYHAQLQAALIT